VALLFAVTTIAAAVGAETWVSRPYAAEPAELRARVAYRDFVAERVLKMTPARRPHPEVCARAADRQGAMSVIWKSES
jgi:hypothetical protein